MITATSFNTNYTIFPPNSVTAIKDLGLTTNVGLNAVLAINSMSNTINQWNHSPAKEFIQAKIITDEGSILVKSHEDLLKDLAFLTKMEMEKCLDDPSGHFKFLSKKTYTQKEIQKVCSLCYAKPFKNILKGSCALASDKAPLVLSVLSNKEVNQYMHEERIRVLPIKVMDLGGEISMKYAKNPQEICRFLDETKTQFGRPVDHLILQGHGYPNQILWEGEELNTKTRFPKGCFKSLSPKATISLVSCNTGNHIKHRSLSFTQKDNQVDESEKKLTIFKNIAQHIANEAKKPVFAPKEALTLDQFNLLKNASSLSTEFFITPLESYDFFVKNIGDKKTRNDFYNRKIKDYTAVFFPQKYPIERIEKKFINEKKVYEKLYENIDGEIREKILLEEPLNEPTKSDSLISSLFSQFLKLFTR